MRHNVPRPDITAALLRESAAHAADQFTERRREFAQHLDSPRTLTYVALIEQLWQSEFIHDLHLTAAEQAGADPSDEKLVAAYQDAHSTVVEELLKPAFPKYAHALSHAQQAVRHLALRFFAEQTRHVTMTGRYSFSYVTALAQQHPRRNALRATGFTRDGVRYENVELRQPDDDGETILIYTSWEDNEYDDFGVYGVPVWGIESIRVVGEDDEQ